MPIRFQADADFNQIIVTALVRRFPEIDPQVSSSFRNVSRFEKPSMH